MSDKESKVRSALTRLRRAIVEAGLNDAIPPYLPEACQKPTTSSLPIAPHIGRSSSGPFTKV